MRSGLTDNPEHVSMFNPQAALWTVALKFLRDAKLMPANVCIVKCNHRFLLHEQLSDYVIASFDPYTQRLSETVNYCEDFKTC